MSLVATTLNIPGQVLFEDLKENNKLLSSEQIKRRYQQHSDSAEVKIKKEFNIFSTVLVREPSEILFALYRGKGSAGCGEGNFGRVKLVQNQDTDEWCVVKIAYEALDPKDEWMNLRAQARQHEVNALKALGRLKGVAFRYDLARNRSVYYTFMEYVPGESLSKNKFTVCTTVEEFLNISITALGSLKELHHLNYLHRDLNESNIMHNPDPATPWQKRTKLIDLGSAMPLDENREVVVKEILGMTSTYPDWRGSDGLLHLSVYTDMFEMGNTLQRLWSTVLDINECTIPKELRTTINRFLNKLVPRIPEPAFSKLTAHQAMEDLTDIKKSLELQSTNAGMIGVDGIF